MVDHESRSSSCNPFDVFSLNIVDLHLVIIPALGIVSCQGSRLLKKPIRKALLVLRFNDHMGAGDSLSVEPPVISRGYLKGEFIVLVIIFSYIDVITIRGQIVEGAAGYILSLIHI